MAQEPERRTLTINLNRAAVSGPALSALRVAGGAVIVSLNALEAQDLRGPVVIRAPGLSFQAEPAVANDESRKATYRAWLLAKGFQDLTRGIRESLEAAHVWIDWIELHGKPLPARGVAEIEADLKDVANRKNFPDLLNRVNAGLSSPLQWEEAFLSMQKARNCLEHRAGTVHQQKDAGAGNPVLRLSIPRLQIVVQDGEREIELVPNLIVENGGHVAIKPTFRIHEFPVGSEIRFSADDFGEIAFACWLMSQELVGKLPNPPANAADVVVAE